jgi:hypothetical protein
MFGDIRKSIRFLGKRQVQRGLETDKMLYLYSERVILTSVKNRFVGKKRLLNEPPNLRVVKMIFDERLNPSDDSRCLRRFGVEGLAVYVGVCEHIEEFLVFHPVISGNMSAYKSVKIGRYRISGTYSMNPYRISKSQIATL